MSRWPLASLRVAIRGGGDLGSGVAYRLHRSGFCVLIMELAQPLLVRRAVSFGSAVLQESITIHGITARAVSNVEGADSLQQLGEIPVLVDPEALNVRDYRPAVVIDARMRKTPPEPFPFAPSLLIGLGPGFVAPANCDAVIETKRGHNLGRVITSGAAEPDTSLPEPVMGLHSRVLRAPGAGAVTALAQIGAHLEQGQPVARVAESVVVAPFEGVLRGLVHDGVVVNEGTKIGDLDPRIEPINAFTISDKALAVGGGALEAILSSPAIRALL